MNKIFLLFFLTLIINSCISEPPENSKLNYKKNSAVKKSTNKKTIKKSNTSKLITNFNVKKKLSEYARNNNYNKIKISTTFGNIYIKLYENTPLHRANFIMLIEKGFFDSTLFYRVINNFMIQGGNSDKNIMFHKMAKIGNYKIPPEISEKYIHKRGALAMAVQEQYYNDPSKHDLASSPYNFYIVQKGPISDNYMDKIEARYNIKIPNGNRKVYKAIGGNPHLDNKYTVFGEVIKGMNVVDIIASQITNDKNRPLKNVYLTMEIIK